MLSIKTVVYQAVRDLGMYIYPVSQDTRKVFETVVYTGLPDHSGILGTVPTLYTRILSIQDSSVYWSIRDPRYIPNIPGY